MPGRALLPFLFFAYFLANGIYPIARPAAWLRAKWTATRGLEPEKPLAGWAAIGIRWGWGLLFLAFAGFAGWITLGLITGTIK
jgi:hypothetical protein